MEDISDGDVKITSLAATPNPDHSHRRHRYQASNTGQEDSQKEKSNDRENEASPSSQSKRAGPKRNSARHGASTISMVRTWLLDMLGRTLSLVKTPISYILVLLVVIFVFSKASSTVIAIFCDTPILSLVCPLKQPVHPPGFPDFDRLITLQSHLEEVQEISADGVTIPLHLKRGEASVKELAILVSASDLRSRKELGRHFNRFVQNSREVSKNLQRFISRVDQTVDTIISINLYTTHILEDVATRAASDAEIGGGLVHNMLAPFRAEKSSPEDVVRRQYIQHMDNVKAEIDVLIRHAQILSMNLDDLDSTLIVIAQIGKREDNDIAADKHKVMSSLWARLGGYGNELYGMDQQLLVLNNLYTYRQAASTLVANAVLSLNLLSSELESLRDRVAKPKVVQQVSKVPLQIQIETVQRGVERLDMGRQKTRIKKAAYLREIDDRTRDGTLLAG